jgi:hypothetical protein
MAERIVKTVRLREGVYASGKRVGNSRPPARVVHLLEIAAGLDSLEDVKVCCGAWFAPGTLEEVPWGDLRPHNLCLKRSSWPSTAIEASLSAAGKILTNQDRSDLAEIMDTAAKIMDTRLDWESSTTHSLWQYSASFNGIFVGERRFPRQLDIGIDPLTAQLVNPGVFRIDACGIHAGCSRHATYSETFPLNDIGFIEEQLAICEHQATSIDLQELSWCLVAGDCAQKSSKRMQVPWQS